MKKDELVQQLNHLSQDPAFAEKLATCENTDALVAILETEGIHTNATNLENILSICSSNGNSTELSEDALDNVSGGSIFNSLYAFYKALTKGNFSSGSGGNGSFGGGGGGGGIR